MPIGRWVLHGGLPHRGRAAATLPERRRTFHMAVNLSARQIARPELVDEVRGILQETGLDAAVR